jgi:tetratricopeptide (TPR) repeat protein
VAGKKARTENRWRRALRMAALTGVVGYGAGLTIAGFVGGLSGQFFGGLPVYFALVTAAVGYLYGALVIETAGDVAQRLYLGGRVGSRREFSHAQALAARGDYDAALEAYAAAADEFPDDPAPLILGARVLREGKRDYRAAEEWLLRARRVDRLERSEAVTIAQELVDLYDGPLEEPRKALPLLARLAEQYPDTSVGEWAARTVARLRTEAWDDVKQAEAPSPPRTPPSNPDPTI